MTVTATGRLIRAARINRFVSAARYLTFGVVTLLAAFVGSPRAGVSAAATASVLVTEVHPAGSGNGSYNADWFEVTNTGTSPVDITGWKMDDNSNSFASAVALNGVGSIAPGQSVVFIDSTAPVNIDAFVTAWFGSNVPAGLTIGTYGGPGVGLSTSGDAVNLFDASGNRITGVNFGTATATATFDNTAGLGSTTLPLPTVSTLSVAGVNGALLAFSGTETGSPGRRINASPLTTVDLSIYVRVGRFDLPEPTRTAPPLNSLLAQEVSAVAYNRDTDTLFVVGDAGTSIVQVSKTGQLIDSMTLAPGGSPQGTDFYDPEGLTYVGGGRFVMVEERDRQAVLFTYVPDTTLTRGDAQTVKLGTFAPNIGIEGISYDPLTGGFIAVKETDPQGIFQTGIDFTAGTATNGSPTTENSNNLFDPALANFLDFADVFALSNLPALSGPESGHLLVLSQESGKIVNIDRNGTISSSLTIASDPGNPLSVPAQQHEGLTMDGNGYLYVVSENGGGDIDHPQLWVYAPSSVPNQSPTAVALNNQVNTIAENTSTAARIKVADVAITDDGLGTNNLTVTGPDAAFFEVDINGLYIRAGTILDYETRTSYSVTVEVDDTRVGSTPDATAAFTLTVTDVIDEIPPASSLFISEVAPWGSGNSPYAVDWFEVTNAGASAVTLTGWRVDDSSNSFATGLVLNGVTSIAPGESVIFMETANLAATSASFLSTWFGAAPPAGLQIGSYSGAGIGLSTGGDAVNLYDSDGVLRANVSFGASPAGPLFPTFDNTSGLNNATISQLSALGVNRAFAAANDANEIGSPWNVPGPAGILIVTEVAPWSSGNSPVGADWFEVTNTGAAPVDVTGWKVDDNSESPVAAVPLNGITSIAPGESVIFIETASLADAQASFRNTWFGATPPAGLQIGSYSGSGIGLSTGGDAVNLYDNSGVLKARVFFGPSPAGPSFPTFDNAAGLNNAGISQLSVAGLNGAFLAANDPNEIGSPGRIVNPVVIPSVVISEVTPWSSGNAPYAADWFEVTNTGAMPVDVSGWKMDDSSNAFASGVALRGVTSIPAGGSAIFLEGEADGSTDATLLANFATAWAGTATLPNGFLVGFYGGAGVGLSTSGDAVILFDASGNRITGVSFGSSTTGFTFDNAAGLGGTTLPLPTVSTLSVAGVNGSFVAADGLETGSPGTIGNEADDDGDGDGFTNMQEIGSAGVPPGNLFGSNPLNPASRPEVCDGVDNDLNEGIDEGFPDTDNDGVRDCVDTDNDNDGIANGVDPSPLDATNETFSDAIAPLTGSTTGAILTRNGKTVAIADATPNPGAGVQVVVSGPGSGPVQIRLGGKATTISLRNGDYILTGPIAISTVAVGAGGPAQITAVLNGFPVVILVGTGSSITYTETPGANGTLAGFRVDAVAGNVTLNGAALSAPLTLVGPPRSADACKKGGWQTFNFPVAFMNQGDCVSFVATANKPPKVKAPGHQKAEATGASGAVVTFEATALDPIEGVLPVTCAPTSGSTFPLGVTIVNCSATNLRGKSDTDTFRVTVRDTTEPDIISVTPSVTHLPDTNQTVPVSIAVAVTDLVDLAPVCQIIRVTGQGRDIDHDNVIDWAITGNLTLNIAANARRHRDRTYTITVTCTDASGNPSREKAAIVISHAP